MRSAAFVSSVLWVRPSTLVLAITCLFAWCASSSAQNTRPPTPEETRSLQAKYRAERDAVLKSGADKRFLPQLFVKAEEMARHGDAALAGGRLLQAAEAFRQARWQLPYEGPQVPDHVARVLGYLRLRHADAILAVAFSPDGKRLATAGQDRCVRIWDLANGHEILTYNNHEDKVRAVAFSSDGKLIASAGDEHRIMLWDPKTGKDVRALKGKGKYVTSLAFSRDAKVLAAGWDDKALRIYDVATGDLKRAVEDFPQQVETAAFSPDGKLFAAGSGDGQVRVWQYPGAVENATQPAFWSQQDLTGPTYWVTFSPDGKTLARCGPDGVKLYNTPQPGAAIVSNLLRTISPGPSELPTIPNRFICAAFSKDGKTLFTGGTDGVIRLWDLDNGLPVGTFRGHNDAVTGLVFNAEGSQLASACWDHTVRLWHFDVVQQARDFTGNEGAVWSAALSPDGLHVVSAGADHAVRLWDISSSKVVRTLAGHEAAVTVALFSPDGKTILSAGGDKVLKLWNAATGVPIHTLKGHQATITAAAFSPDGQKIVSGGADRCLKIWDARAGKELVNIADNHGVVMAVAFSPDGKQVAAGNVDQTIRLWDAATGKAGLSWTAHNEAVSGIAFSADAKLLASCGADQLVKVWKLAEMPEGRPITLPGHTGPLSSVAFRADGRFLVSAGADQVVKLWKLDSDSGKETQSFRGHKDWVTSVAFSRDGFYVISASVDKSVKLWEVTTRDLPLLSEHTGAVEACVISPDGKLIASGATDRTIKVWDLASGVERYTLTGHTTAISALAFTPDSKTLVSASMDGIRLWQTASGKELPRQASYNDHLRKFLRAPPALAVTPDGKRLLVWLRGNERSTTVSVNDLATGQPLLSFNDTGRPVVSLTFSADGKKAAIGASNGTVRMYDLEKRGEMLPGGDWFLFDSKAGVADLVFTPDAKLLYVGNDLGEVKICKVANREVVRTFKAHNQRVGVLIMSADGKRLASAGHDNVIKVWDTITGEELRRWDLHQAVQRDGFVSQMSFTPDGLHLLTANANTTLYLLELP